MTQKKVNDDDEFQPQEYRKSTYLTGAKNIDEILTTDP